MAAQKYVIILDEPSPAVREAVQKVVKEHANGWWHRLPNVWMVGGHSAAFWRDQISPLLPNPGATSVLVLRLAPNSESAKWSYWGPNAADRMAWLHRNFHLDT